MNGQSVLGSLIIIGHRRLLLIHRHELTRYPESRSLWRANPVIELVESDEYGESASAYLSMPYALQSR
jgi:hypothetical protein